MCAIAGIVDLGSKAIDRRALEGMSDLLRHRGPDDEGVFFDDNVGLSHRRLSIIDLTKNAHQPMANEDGTVTAVHNGEIYNFPELKTQLEGLGHRFRSGSDTEVIVHAYEEWGADCLSRFNGMWAFAVWDKRKRELFAARDRFGIKPFYYYYDGTRFIFASEIKALISHPLVGKRPNDQSVYHYLASGYGYMDISDETFFDGIRQLKPAHYFRISADDGKLEERAYWDLDPGKRAIFKDEKHLLEQFLSIFEDSIRLRLRSDVPVGISLSGGLDSSSVACIASKFLGGNTMEGFSSCFEEEEFDERRFIKPILERTGIRPNYIFTKPEDVFSELDDILWHQEEPYSTLSILPQWYVMKLAREKGIKVLLTGQAGDETHAGYPKYFFYYFADLIKSMRWGAAAREIAEYRRLKGVSMKDVALPTANILASYALPAPVKRIANSLFNGKTPSYMNGEFAQGHKKALSITRRYKSILNNDLYNALKVSPLPSLLHIDDRSSMAHSVESRTPFLDYRLVEFLFSVPAEHKIKDGFTKYILRQSLKGTLPDKVRLRRDKMGFPTPLEAWFKTVLKSRVEDLLNSREFSSRPYFDPKGVRQEFSEYLRGKTGSQYTIWSWVNLEMWFRKFID
ncbi:asparagine synthase (glutamine-hydrolyzing) [Candidatus Omnitrophota bacterium]